MEDRGDLEAARQAFAADSVRRQAVDPRAIEQDLARRQRKAAAIRLNSVVLPAPFGPMMA